jgi:hypothetical protein
VTVRFTTGELLHLLARAAAVFAVGFALGVASR